VPVHPEAEIVTVIDFAASERMPRSLLRWGPAVDAGSCGIRKFCPLMQSLHAVLPLVHWHHWHNAPTCAVLHHDHCRVRPSKLSWPRPGPRRSGWLLRNFGKVQSHVHIAAAVAEPHWCLPSSPWMNRMNFEPSTVCIGFVCEKKSGFVWKWGYPKMDGLYWKILRCGWFGWSQF